MRDETGRYLAHRLKLAGCELPLFEPPTVEAIYQTSSGLPRKANSLAHHALFAAAIGKAKTVTTEHPSSSASATIHSAIVRSSDGVAALVRQRGTAEASGSERAEPSAGSEPHGPEYDLGPSRWIHVRAESSEGHWVEAQVLKALELVHELTGGELRNRERPKVYVISPFTVAMLGSASTRAFCDPE
jgi:hypothetical protein